MMKPYRIAYVDHAEDLGGAEKSLLEMTCRLDRDRYVPLLLHTRGAKWLRREDCEHLERIPVFSPGGVLARKRGSVGAGLLGSLRDMFASARPVYRIVRSLRRHEADLVHTNSLKAHLLGGLAARMARLPLIWHMRDLLDEGEGLGIVRQAAATCKPRVIAISEAVARQFDGLRVSVEVVPNGVPLERFTPGDPPEGLRAEWGLTRQDQVVMCLGRLTPWKGHRTLLQAFARVAEQRPGARLLVVGEVAFWADEYGEELHALAGRLGLDGRVIWAGFRADVPELLRLCQVLVLPSRNEPFGRVLIEAMATAKPVIATNSGGAPEIVVPEETGLLVPPEDAEALARALLQLLGDADLRQRLGRAGLARARERFDVRRVVEQVQGTYREMLGEDR
jgi:glycosyltransferase involved in cell wall biosynthesis